MPIKAGRSSQMAADPTADLEHQLQQPGTNLGDE
jgi:hypothetical protein